jgi:hypothetical protein
MSITLYIFLQKILMNLYLRAKMLCNSFFDKTLRQIAESGFFVSTGKRCCFGTNIHAKLKNPLD